jgi:RNA polymerase sigma factor (sigma-70 family)
MPKRIPPAPGTLRARLDQATGQRQRQRLYAERDRLVLGDGTKEHPGVVAAVWQIAHGFYRRNPALSLDDLAQTGLVAALVAAERYDPASGWAFITFCWKCVVHRLIVESKRQKCRVMDVPHNQLAGSNGDGYPEPVARALGVLSIHDRFDGGEGNYHHEPAVEPDTPDVLEAAKLRHALARLPWRHREVLELRHGLDPEGRPRSLTEVATVFGITKTRVQQLEAVALKKLRKELVA